MSRVPPAGTEGEHGSPAHPAELLRAPGASGSSDWLRRTGTLDMASQSLTRRWLAVSIRREEVEQTPRTAGRSIRPS
jgi:hypothetical protein